MPITLTPTDMLSYLNAEFADQIAFSAALPPAMAGLAYSKYQFVAGTWYAYNTSTNLYEAVSVPYDNTLSGLAANTVQDALDALAGGGGGGSGGSVALYTGVKLYDNALISAGTWDVDNSDLISGTRVYGDYDRIEVFGDFRATASVSAAFGKLTINNDTTNANYLSTRIFGGTSAATAGNQGAVRDAYAVVGASATADFFNPVHLVMQHPGKTDRFKVVGGADIEAINSSTQVNDIFALQWRNTAAVTRLALEVDNATTTFAAGSRLIIIGYKEQFVGNGYSTANVTNPPTDTELDGAFGTPASVGAGFVGIVNDNAAGTSEYLCWSDGTNWFFAAGTKAT